MTTNYRAMTVEDLIAAPYPEDAGDRRQLWKATRKALKMMTKHFDEADAQYAQVAGRLATVRLVANMDPLVAVLAGMA